MVLTDNQLQALRRKLEALGYTDAVDPSSGPLVQKLTDDLVHTTDSYRTLKLQCARQAQEVNALNEKVEALKKDSATLQADNSQLHVMLIKAREENSATGKDSYQTTKKLEDRIAELSFWKQGALAQLQAAEKENAALKTKLQELVSKTDQLTSGRLDPQSVTPRISIAAPPKVPSTPPPAGAPKSPTGSGRATPSVDLMAASNARIAALQRQLSERDEQLRVLQQQVGDGKIAVQQREAEISRLGLRAGGDAEVVALTARNKANEDMILQLNRTVDALLDEKRTLEAAVRDKPRLEAALAAAERVKSEAEDKLRRAVRENENIMHEVLQLRADLATLQATNSQANAIASAEVDTALNSASALRVRLADSRKEQDKLKSLLDSVAGERNAALSQVSALERELGTIKTLLTEMQQRAEEYRNESVKSKNELFSTKERLLAQDLAVEELQRKVAALTADLEARKKAIDTSEKDRLAALSRIEELQGRLEGVEQSAGKEHSTNLQLASQLARTESDLRAAESNLRTAEAEAQKLQKQLKEAVEARVKAQGVTHSLEDERTRLQRELASVSTQATELRTHLEQSTTTRTQLELEKTRLTSEVSVTQSELRALQERLDSVTQQLHDGRAAWDNAQRELNQLQALPTRLEDVQEQLRGTIVRLSGAEAEAARAKAEVSRLTEHVTRTESELREARRLLDGERDVVTALKAQVQELDQIAGSAAAHARTLEAERDSLATQHRMALADAASLRDALAAEGTAAQQADGAARDLQTRLASAGRQLAVKEEECARLNSALAQAQQAADAARAREEEARASAREMAERARRAETLAAEHQADVSQLSATRDGMAAHMRELEAALSTARSELEARRVEVEQLTTLSLRGDATVQEYMANIKAMSNDLRAAEMRVSDLVGEVASRDDALSRLGAEATDLRRVVAGLDADRDALQAELDSKAEQLVSLSRQLDALNTQAGETQRLLAMAEGRLAHSDARVRESDNELMSLRSQLSNTMEQVRALSRERDSLQGELRAVSEDLEALVRENQVVSSELSQACQQRDALNDELRRNINRSTSAEQMVRAKDAEVEDLRRAYESVSAENQRLVSTVSSLEKEAAAREAQLSHKSQEAASLAEASRAAQAQANQYILDLQAFERQVDGLSRQLAKSESSLEDAGRERDVLLEELRAAQQVRLGLERHREELQRQIASLDSQLAVSRARLEDAAAETTSLNQRMTLERNRVCELEALLAGMRAREYKQDLVSKHGDSQLGVMQERNRVLEEQVTALQHQITSLQQAQQAQDREMAALRNEALALAAQAAAEGGLSHEASEQAHEMTRRVIELEKRCADLQAQLSVAHSDARAQRDAAVTAAAEASSLRRDNESLLTRTAQLETAVQQRAKQPANRPSTASTDEQSARLQAQLKEEQSKRRQAERDFLELMSSIEDGVSTVSGANATNTLASKRLAEMQRKLDDTESQKNALEENISKTRALMVAMQNELQRIQSEYGVASGSLSELLGVSIGTLGSGANTPSLSAANSVYNTAHSNGWSSPVMATGRRRAPESPLGHLSVGLTGPVSASRRL